tara:strand:- start:1937 stop:2059 length:123 start_codon:yes stop_codon:yes gene_type:complete
VKNGYGRVTKECIMSAGQSDDPKLRDKAKRYLLENLVKEK